MRLGETFFASSIIGHWSLAVRLVIGSKTVCLQQRYARTVPVRRKTCVCCDHVFRSKRKAECNLRKKAMKRTRAVESDSVKSARKAKDKLHKLFKERQKLVSKFSTGRNRTECG